MTVSSDSESDDDLARLREAVDCDTLRENLYSKQSSVNVSIKDQDSVEASFGDLPGAVDNPKSMSDNIKAIIKANSNKVKAPKIQIDAPSLRRDRLDDSKPSVMSELEVTPQFQKFVGNKLDDFLEKHIKDVLKNKEEAVDSKDDTSELKLLKRSKVVLKEVEEVYVKRSRPELLAHRKVELSSEELSTCAVTGDFVQSKVEVEGWVNRFAGRVEEGVERIKKKKKKVKKKKKDASVGDKIASDEKLLNESEKVEK